MYAPETGLSGGVGFYFIQHDTLQREIFPYPDEIEFYVNYSVRNQLQTKIEPVFYFRNGWRVNGRLDYYYFPDLFWGVGSNTAEKSETDYTLNSYSFSGAVDKSIYRIDGKDIFLGGGAKYNRMTSDLLSGDSDSLSQVLADLPRTYGITGNETYELNINTIADLRDNILLPKEGMYHKGAIRYGYFTSAEGENGSYIGLDYDVRDYYDLGEGWLSKGRQMIAMQFVASQYFGRMPFNALPKIGSNIIMRGYYEGRYRDMSMYAFQTEYRFPLFWRFRGAAFASIGHVNENLYKAIVDVPLWAVGIGGRFVWDRSTGLSARLDIGLTEEGPGIYLNVKEAF
ncbi:MAG: BamA/TamA family outer membrane protein [Candidatus Kapaibacteriales bacterium]